MCISLEANLLPMLIPIPKKITPLTSKVKLTVVAVEVEEILSQA